MAGCFLLLLSASAFSQAELVEINAPGHVGDWVLDGKSGRIFASLQESGEVAEFDPSSGKLIRRWAAGAEPGEMIVKGRRLVVALGKSASLATFDLEADRPGRTVDLQGSGPYALFCSQAGNPYVYAVCRTGDELWDAEVFQVDLREGRVRNRENVRAWSQPRPRHVTMSPDGKTIIPDARVPRNQHGVVLMAVDEEKGTFRDLPAHQRAYGQTVAGRVGRFWFLGNKLYPLDLSEEIRIFAGSPSDFHGRLDLVASVKNDGGSGKTDTRVVLETLSSARKIGQVNVGKFDLEGYASTPDRVLAFDAERDRLFYGHGSRAVVVDLESLGLTFQPLFLMKVSSVVSVELGKTLTLALELNDPTYTDRTTFELKSAPKGVRLAGRRLEWTPSTRDVGSHEVVVEAKMGEARDSISIRVDVNRPVLELEHPVYDLRLSPSGRRALVLSRPGIASGEKAAVLLLIDVERRRVIAERTLPQGVRAVHLDERGVYVAPAQGGLFYVFKPDDLGDLKRTFLKTDVNAFGTLPDGQLVVIAGNERILYDAKSLKRTVSLRATSSFNPMADDVVRRLRDGYLFGNQVYDESGKVILRVGMSGMPLFTKWPRNSLALPTPWNRQVRSNGLKTGDGRRVADWSGSSCVLLSGHPLAACSRSTSSGARVRTDTSLLDLRDLMVGNPRQTLVVDRRPVNPKSGRSIGGPLLVRVSGTLVVLAAGRSVYFVRIEKEVLKDLPMPVVFRHAEIPIEAGIDKPVTFTLEAEGGTGPMTYQLLFEIEGLSLDAKTGAVTADLPAIWKGFVDRTREDLKSNSSPKSVVKRLKSLADRGREEYAFMTGGATDDVPFQLPVHVAATDSEGQTDKLPVSLVVLVPSEEFEKALEAGAEEPAPSKFKRYSPAWQLEDVQNRVERIEQTLDSLSKQPDEPEPAPPDKGIPAIFWILLAAGWGGVVILAFVLGRRASRV